MITSLSQPQFISRIFTDPTGRHFRLNFFVAVIDGEVRGHLLSVEPLANNVALLAGEVSDGAYCLPIICIEKKANTTYINPFIGIVSPYFSTEFLINSQPTRAPSF